MKNVLFVVGLCLVSACQVLAGTAPLDIGPGDAGTLDIDIKPAGSGGKPVTVGGSGGTAGDTSDAGPLDAGHDGGPPDATPDCIHPEGSECKWLEPCGCDEGEICQARGADEKGTCVKAGKKKLGEVCGSPDDCEEGTCDQRVCRSYCTDLCNDGRCLPATVEGDKLSDKIKVCWKSCQAGTDSCQDGTTCQTRDINTTKAAFCLPPANPCPTAEDGKCDEPTICAAGTDSADCSCMKDAGAECNHVDQCGCPKGKSCELSDTTRMPVCAVRAMPGLQSNELCTSDQSCGAGLTCTFNPYGSCKAYCADSTDCPGATDECAQVTDSEGKDVPGFKICRTGCSDSSPCPANNGCIKGDTGAFCRPFVPEVPGATCNLTYQMGCDGMPNAACNVVASGNTITAECTEHSGALPTGAACDSSSTCQAGLTCLWGVCRHFCDPSVVAEGEPAPGCSTGVCIEPPLAAGGDAPFSVCLVPCKSDSECGSGLQCKVGQVGGQVGYCRAPLTDTCTTNDGECDEPIPRGTGLCAPGYDTADCAVSP